MTILTKEQLAKIKERYATRKTTEEGFECYDGAKLGFLVEDNIPALIETIEYLDMSQGRGPCPSCGADFATWTPNLTIKGECLTEAKRQGEQKMLWYIIGKLQNDWPTKVQPVDESDKFVKMGWDNACYEFAQALIGLVK